MSEYEFYHDEKKQELTAANEYFLTSGCVMFEDYMYHSYYKIEILHL